MEGIFNAILDAFGLEAAAVAGILALAALVFRAIGNAIPDSAVGILGLLRKISKVLGLYVSNRIDKGESTATIAKKVNDGTA